MTLRTYSLLFIWITFWFIPTHLQTNHVMLKQSWLGFKIFPCTPNGKRVFLCWASASRVHYPQHWFSHESCQCPDYFIDTSVEMIFMPLLRIFKFVWKIYSRFLHPDSTHHWSYKEGCQSYVVTPRFFRDWPLVLSHIDASQIGRGAVLLQHTSNSNWYLCMLFSLILSPSECSYDFWSWNLPAVKCRVILEAWKMLLHYTAFHFPRSSTPASFNCIGLSTGSCWETESIFIARQQIESICLDSCPLICLVATHPWLCLQRFSPVGGGVWVCQSVLLPVSCTLTLPCLFLSFLVCCLWILLLLTTYLGNR